MVIARVGQAKAQAPQPMQSAFSMMSFIRSQPQAKPPTL